MAKVGDYAARLRIDRWYIVRLQEYGEDSVRISPFPLDGDASKDLATAMNVGRYERKARMQSNAPDRKNT